MKRYRRRGARTGRISGDAAQAFADNDRGRLHHELALKPWQPSPLDVFCGGCPWPDGTAGARAWPDMMALREQLETAAKRSKEN